MKTSRDELKRFFENGKLPTGENFAELIDSMVHFSEFDEHEEEFKKWTERGKISLGAGGDTYWELSVDDAERLQVQRVEDEEAKPDDRVAKLSTPDVNLVGWTGMTGRIGTSDGERAFAGEAAELDFGALSSVKSDGNWYQIVGAPERPCAFEITAAVVGPKEMPGSELVQFLDRLLGNAKPKGAVVHAVAAANGAPGARPALRQTAQPTPKSGWRILGRRLWALLLIAVVAVLVLESPLLDSRHTTGQSKHASSAPDPGVTAAESQQVFGPQDSGDTDGGSEQASNTQDSGDADGGSSAGPVTRAVSEFFQTSLGLKGVADWVLSYPAVSIVVLVLLLLYLLRTLMFAYRNQRNSIQLVWSRASGSRLTGSATYTLQMRGPLYPAGDAKVHYHITKLWS